MKKISLFLVSSLLLQSLAWATPKDSLRNVMDEYRYALTVEWDQKDQKALEAIKASFGSEVKKIVAEEKLSSEDIKAFLQENSHELNLADAEIALLVDAQENLDAEKAQDLLSEKAKGLYKQGSHWAPLEDIALYGGIGLLVFELIVLIITTKDDPCPNPEYHPNDVPYSCNY